MRGGDAARQDPRRPQADGQAEAYGHTASRPDIGRMIGRRFWRTAKHQLDLSTAADQNEISNIIENQVT